MGFVLGFISGAVVCVAIPHVNGYAVKARDWLFDLFRPKGPDDTDSAGV